MPTRSERLFGMGVYYILYTVRLHATVQIQLDGIPRRTFDCIGQQAPTPKTKQNDTTCFLRPILCVKLSKKYYQKITTTKSFRLLIRMANESVIFDERNVNWHQLWPYHRSELHHCKVNVDVSSLASSCFRRTATLACPVLRLALIIVQSLRLRSSV